MTLRIDVLTLFPAMIEGPLAESIPGRILDGDLASLTRPRPARVGPRQASRPSTTRPTAGERGWCCAPNRSPRRSMRCATPESVVILLDPGGEVFRQARARDLATRSHLIFVCPRYEGIDERIRSLVDLELSIGDYVVTGGELPALVVIDAVIRLLPGAIDAASTDEESFDHGLLEYPQYTRPAGLPRDGRAGHPDLRRSRRGRALATRAGDRTDPPAATGSPRRPGAGRLMSREAVLYSAADAPVRVAPGYHPRSHGCPDESGTAA